MRLRLFMIVMATLVLACGDGSTATTTGAAENTGDPSTTASATTLGTSTAPATGSTTGAASGSTAEESAEASSEILWTGGSVSTGLGRTSGGTRGDSTSTGAPTSSSGSGTSCVPLVDNADPFGLDCSEAPCPAGYDCIDHHGIVLQQLCGVLCIDDCNCPAPTTCTEFTDKAGTHYECA